MALVTLAGAGPPFLVLYLPGGRVRSRDGDAGGRGPHLTPKSPSGPPGLCEAVRMIPPYAAPPSRELRGGRSR